MIVTSKKFSLHGCYDKTWLVKEKQRQIDIAIRPTCTFFVPYFITIFRVAVLSLFEVFISQDM